MSFYISRPPDLSKKALPPLKGSPTQNCENCNIQSPRHVRVALRYADVFSYSGGASGHSVQMFGAPAAVPRLTLHFDLSLSAPYRNGGYI